MSKFFDAKFNIGTVVNFAKDKIVELTKKEISNEEKKEILDNAVTAYIIQTLNAVSPNFFIRWAITKLLLPNISIITQKIFDLLKEKIDGLTKE